MEPIRTFWVCDPDFPGWPTDLTGGGDYEWNVQMHREGECEVCDEEHRAFSVHAEWESRQTDHDV
jgi:hypothetical protein